MVAFINKKQDCESDVSDISCFHILKAVLWKQRQKWRLLS